MPKRKQVDGKKLIKSVEDGMTSREIMAEFGFSTLAQLKSFYLDALTAEGKVPGITFARGRAAAPAGESNLFKINKRGSLIVPKEMIETMGFKLGDSFSVRKTVAGISLKTI
ncbi:MAG: hypothetical protein SV487_02680 [Thermodesulfobacteriota bacterium]|nr:hypothetical protein [Thermodesulfobacteriota bacterium]